MDLISEKDILFISDLHLSENRPDLVKAFIEFCNSKALKASSLYILGDLFDAWLGDDNKNYISLLVISELKKLNANNVKVFFMPGNRDFLVGNEFEKLTNCKIISDPQIINNFNKKILLMHGDSLCTDDEEYMQFRKYIRSSNIKNEILTKPLEERIKLANDLRAKSKSANASKAEDIMDVNHNSVIEAMKKNNAKILIHGHTHRPMKHNINEIDSSRYVLGDWDVNGWYIKLNKFGLELLSFKIN